MVAEKSAQCIPHNHAQSTQSGTINTILHNHAQSHNHYSNFENILMKLHNHTQSYTIKHNHLLKHFFKVLHMHQHKRDQLQL